MTKEFKKLAEEIWQTIDTSERILLHLHPSPDGDCTGSALAMMWALEGMGKKVTVISGDSQPPGNLSSLPGFGKISVQTISQTNLANYDLFLIQDAAGMEQISRLEKFSFPANLKTVVIDHHRSNPAFGQVNLIDSNYPAVCQIIYDLLKWKKVKLTPEIASNLYVGIYTDTGGFKYPPTDEKTLKAAADLTRVSKDFTRIIFTIENANTPEKILFLGLALNSIEHYFDDNLALSVVTQKKLNELKIDKSQTEKSDIANTLKSVIGWNIGICMMEVDDGIVNLSMRTRDAERFDVSKIAVAVGGGGHKAAAGATIKMPLDEAKKFLLTKIKEIYPELGEA